MRADKKPNVSVHGSKKMEPCLFEYSAAASWDSVPSDGDVEVWIYAATKMINGDNH
jgi:hypothetical protein